MIKIAVKGGIGDFLQCLPFMLAHPHHKYYASSHYDRVSEFFAAFGLTVEEVSLGKLAGIDNCPRETFFYRNPFPRLQPLFTNNRPVLGIHLGGSNYSISVEKRFGFPSKALPVAVFDALVAANKQYNIILFGEAIELDALVPFWRKSKYDHLKFVADDDVTVSLSYVTECSVFVGSDSAFKTMSAMLHIPTVVWIGDYKDAFRDDKFIDPYVKAGVMKIYRYWDLSLDYEINAGLKLCQKQIEEIKGKDRVVLYA